jgi:hypothetical protein
MRIEVFSQTLNAVFGTNLRMLIALLRQTATDVGLQIQMIQNVARPDVRNQFNGTLILLLHNYVASAAMLTDHSRRLMRDRTGDLHNAFSEMKAELLKNLEVPFIQGLRNFMLHRSLPVLGQTLNISDFGTGGPQFKMTVELSAKKLLEWDGWQAASKAFIRVGRLEVRCRLEEVSVATEPYLLKRLACEFAAGFGSMIGPSSVHGHEHRRMLIQPRLERVVRT